MTCIHQPHGLCASCQSEHDADPLAWLEFGNHPAGLARWQSLQTEMADRPESVPVADDPALPY